MRSRHLASRHNCRWRCTVHPSSNPRCTCCLRSRCHRECRTWRKCHRCQCWCRPCRPCTDQRCCSQDSTLHPRSRTRCKLRSCTAGRRSRCSTSLTNSRAARRRRNPSNDLPGRFRHLYRRPCSRLGRCCCSNNLDWHTGCPGSRRCQGRRRQRRGCCCRSSQGRRTPRWCCLWGRHSMPGLDRRTWRRSRCCISCSAPCTSRCSGRLRSKAIQARRRSRKRRHCRRRRPVRRKLHPGSCRCPRRSNRRCCKRCPSSRRSQARRR